MKVDEIGLAKFMLLGPWDAYRNRTPRDFGEAQAIPDKRIEYLCSKWDRRGWYEWGVSLDLGWLTPQGEEALRKLAPK